MATTTLILSVLLFAILLVQHFRRKRRLGPLPPGPTGWPIIGNALDIPTSYQWITFANWGQRWGDILSVSFLGKSLVILNSSKHAIDILEKKSSIYCGRPSWPVAGDMIGWSRTVIMAPYGPRLREMRKMLAQVLASRKSVARFHPLIEDETRHFLLGLRHRPESLVADLYKLAGTIIVMVAYGYKVRGDEDPFIKTVDQVMEEFALAFAPGAFLADVFPFLRHIPSWVPGAQWKRKVAEQKNNLDWMINMPFDWVKEKMKAGTALPSFAATLLETNSDPEREELIKVTSASLYAGGADTTVSAISTFFLAMSCFPDVQRKAQMEIDAVVGPDRLPSLQDRDQMPYMNALILEVLRWIPVAPIAFMHQLIQDDFHEGYFLPKGTLVIANVWKILHDPQTYSDPTRFNPDRFIPSDSVEAERDPRDFCFGFGRRKCPGIVFAEASIFAACSMTLAVYNISKEVRNGQVVQPLIEGTGALISHPLPFKCSITVRSAKAQALLDSMAEGVQDHL
ncbi:cytochrome P450 [Trametes punicea]|nr:cytochrome P450 [Trametes punicea]